MNAPESKLTPEEIEEIKARRRRARWSAFMTPFITLASIVISVSLLMYLIRSCAERNPQSPFIQRPAVQPAPPK